MTPPEKQQQWTARVLFLCALLQLLLVYIAYRVDRAKRVPLISTAAWAIGFGVVLGAFLSYMSPARASHEGLDPQILFFGLLPPIVLEAGFNTQRKGFFSNFLAICLLAVVGTLVATLATGGLVFWLGSRLAPMTSLSLSESLLYGALISAIDPISTLVVLRKSRAPSLLFNLLFGESVINDAVVIVVFGIFQSAALDGEAPLTGSAIPMLLLQLVGISVGSVLLAAVICYTSAFCLTHADDALRQHPTYEIATLLLSPYASYVACQSLQLSGLLAVFISGVLVRHYHFYSVAHASAAAFTQTIATAAFLAENLVYLYLGASLLAYADTFRWDWVFIAVSLAASLLARALSTFPLCALANLWRSARIPFSYQLVIWFSGLRGSIAFALALNVRTRGSGDHAAVVRASTLVTVMLTTVVFGAATGPLLQVLGLARREPSTVGADANAPTSARELSTDEAVPLLGVDALTEVDVGADGRVRRAWSHFDERHLKPVFGGNPRASTS